MGRGSVSAALDALGDPTRREIVAMLAEAPASVQALADRLPISRPAVSRHLRLLKDADLVTNHADGARRIYRLQPDGVELLRAYFEELWGDAATRFRITAENLGPQEPT